MTLYSKYKPSSSIVVGVYIISKLELNYWIILFIMSQKFSAEGSPKKDSNLSIDNIN